jgi:D-methionine transport system substrate-binding protein
MKKIIAAILALCLCLSLAACGPKNEDKTIKVGATPAPHAEILEVIKEALAAEGWTLEIVEFNDYVQPNTAVDDGELDANYFQHKPYMDTFNEENSTALVSVAAIHYEPFGIYPGSKSSLDDIASGDKISIPNDGSNRARALLLLEAEGLIKLKEGVGMEATILDITENALDLDIIEMEAAQLPGTRDSVAYAVINGNYALGAGLNVSTDALASEDAASEAAQTFANIIVVKEGSEENAAVLALIEALQSDAVREFIETTYAGSVVAMF